MAEIGQMFSIADALLRKDPNHKEARIVKRLSQRNPFIRDAIWREGNLPTGNQTTFMTEKPTVYNVAIGEGVPISKSRVEKRVDTVGLFSSRAKIPALHDIQTEIPQWRASEMRAHLDKFPDQIEEGAFYGNSAFNPKNFDGVSTFLNTTDQNSVWGKQVVDGGGTGADNTSAWFITWDPDIFHLIYPQGGSLGVKHINHEKQQALDAAGNEYTVLLDEYYWKVGLTIKDPRYISRVANIDTSDLATFGQETDTSPNLIHLLIDALHALENIGDPNPESLTKQVLYVNRKVHTALTKMALEGSANSNLALSMGQEFGRPQTMFQGIPIHVADSILNTEAQVV